MSDERGCRELTDPFESKSPFGAFKIRDLVAAPTMVDVNTTAPTLLTDTSVHVIRASSQMSLMLKAVSVRCGCSP
jgi:hypothetical protein